MLDEDDYEQKFRDLHPEFDYPGQEDDEEDEHYETRCKEAEEEFLYDLRRECQRGCTSGCNWCLML